MSTGVVLACADQLLTEQFMTVLSEAAHIEVHEIVTDSTNLLIAADRDDVEVVVLHESIGPVAAGQTTVELVAARPYLGVIWLVDDARSDVLAHAVEVGARSVLTVPLSLEETQARIDAAAAWSRSLLSHLGGDGMLSRRGRVLALAGAKGGVGTTILATLLADAAVGPGRTVVLVDLDVRNGAVGFYTDVTVRRSIADLAEVARELTGRSIREVVHQHPSGLSLVLAPDEVERAEDVTGEAVRQIITQLRLQYNQVVIDCGSRLDDATAMAVELADEVCLVTTPDIVAIRGARRAIAMWERLGVRRPEAVKVLLNRVSRRSEVQPDLVRQILPSPLVGEVPAAFASLEQSINTGVLEGRPGPVHAALARLGDVFGLRGAGPPAAAIPNQPNQPSRPDLRRPTGRRRRTGLNASEAGQSVVELPALVFLMGISALICLQMVFWGVSHVFAGHAALEASRTASVTRDVGAINASVDKALPLAWDSGWSVGYPASDRVSVTVHTPTLLPWLGDLDVTSTAHIVAEQP